MCGRTVPFCIRYVLANRNVYIHCFNNVVYYILGKSDILGITTVPVCTCTY